MSTSALEECAGPAVTELPEASVTDVPPAIGRTCWSKVSVSSRGGEAIRVPAAGDV